MGLDALDLNLLPVLEALLEEQSITRAGTRLGTDPANVSRELARLRRHYQDPLLTRGGNDYSLTPLARSLLHDRNHQRLAPAPVPRSRNRHGRG